MIDFLSSQPHYSDHLLPIWFALPSEERGTFYAVDKAAVGVQAAVGEHFQGTYPRLKGPLVVVASYNDFQIAKRAGREVVLLNHGSGQRYGGRLKGHPAYAGGNGRGDVALFLEPGPYAANLTREKGGNVVEVGVPKMDVWHQFPAEPSKPVVAVSWHWHCVSGVPETDWAWPEYKDAVAELATEVKVLGHAHPRAWSRLEKWYLEVGIEPVQSFGEVLQRASVFCVDNSSAGYEFSSTGRPVVWMNSKYYRRDVEQGLRFWSLIPGRQVNYPQEFVLAVHAANIAYRSKVPDDYSPVMEQVYAYTDGQAAKRAAQAILELGAEMDPYKPKRKAQIPERPPEIPQFPLARLQRIGASTKEIQNARAVWDSMDSQEEQFAAAAEFDAMGDVELRGALQETQEVPKFSEMTIPEIRDYVGSSKHRAQLALDAERAREEAKEGRARSTLIASLQRVLDA